MDYKLKNKIPSPALTLGIYFNKSVSFARQRLIGWKSP
jgi:hypothetical protein